MENLSLEIEKTRERLRLLEQLQGILDNPETAEIARQHLLGKSKTKRREQQVEGLGKKKAVDVLLEWFRARQNRPATLREISEGTGYPIPSVRQIVYSRHSDMFENVGRRGRETEFRLSEK